MKYFLSWICLGSLGSDWILPPVTAPCLSATQPGTWYFLLFTLVLTQVRVFIIVIQLGLDSFLVLSDRLCYLELIHWIECLSKEDFGVRFVQR